MTILRDGRLRALLAAEVVSSLGTQMTWLALPWFVLRTTGSPERMTWVIIAEVVPVGVLGFWGGAIAARVGTRRTMLACDLLRVPIFVAIPALHAAGALPFGVLLALVATSGIFLAPYFSVQRSVVPELIGEEHADVAEATAFFQAANRLTIFLGPPAAGLLIGVIGTADVSTSTRRRISSRSCWSGSSSIRPRSRPTVRPSASSTGCASSSATSSCGSGRRRSR